MSSADHAETVAPVEPATYSVPELARRLGVSERHLHRLRDAGRLPQEIRLGRLLRWRREEVEGWIASGCPTPRKHAK